MCFHDEVKRSDSVSKFDPSLLSVGDDMQGLESLKELALVHVRQS